jgi:hypothetical protein
VTGSRSHYVAAQHPQYLESPGPGAYEYRTEAPPVAKMGMEPRFRAADQNPRVGPGSYYNWDPAPRRAAMESTELARDTWLNGAVGGHQVVTGSAQHHVDKQFRLASPGPGAYEAPQWSAFERAGKPNYHQVPLESRAY